MSHLRPVHITLVIAGLCLVGAVSSRSALPPPELGLKDEGRVPKQRMPQVRRPLPGVGNARIFDNGPIVAAEGITNPCGANPKFKGEAALAIMDIVAGLCDDRHLPDPAATSIHPKGVSLDPPRGLSGE